MLSYKAMYKFLGDGVHGEVLDFPGVVSHFLGPIRLVQIRNLTWRNLCT